MKYSVYQHWDPLKVCMVGKSYSPEFYSFIENSRVRTVMERIAEETEEDYQKLIKLLESFGVEIIRPEVSNDYTQYIGLDGKIMPPPMCPRDYSIMLGEDFFFCANNLAISIFENWEVWKGANWPDSMPTSGSELQNLPDWIKEEIVAFSNLPVNMWSNDILKWDSELVAPPWKNAVSNINKNIKNSYNVVPWELNNLNSAMTTRIGKDIYIGTDHYGQDLTKRLDILNQKYPTYR